MSKNTILWDAPIIKATLSTDSTVSILAVTAAGLVVKRPPIDTSSFLTSALTNGHLLIGNVSNVATDVPVTGDVTISNAGVTTIGAGKISNSNVNASAAIAVSKLAALTASRAAVLDGSGFLAASTVTSATLAFLDTTSSVQTQINTKLTATITSVAAGDMLRYSGSAWVNFAKGSDGQFLKMVAGAPEWATLTPPSIPTGGTAGQYLNKIDGTDFNTQWSTLTIAKVTDITASAAEINKLHTVTASAVELNYSVGVTSGIQSQLNAKQATITGGASTIATSNLSTDLVLISDGAGKVVVSGVSSTTLAFLDATSSVQTQINSKLSNTLAQNAIFVGNSSNQAGALAAGTEGYVLAISGGTPAWVAVVGTGTVTSIDVSGGTTGLTSSGGPVTTTGTITLAGTVNATHGGTAQTTWTTGDIMYASAANTLSKLAKGSANTLLGINNAGTIPEYKTASNGLTAASTSLKLGGSITDDTTLELDATTNRFFAIECSGGGSGVIVDNGASTAAQGDVAIVGTGADGSFTLNFDGYNNLGDGAGVVFVDSRGTVKGIQYGAGGYVTTDRSLTDRGYVLGAKTFADKQTFYTSIAGSSSLNIPQGAAVTSPNNGDVWTTSSGFFARINGATYNFTTTSGVTNSAANNELMMSNGTNAVSSNIFISSTADVNLGVLATTGGTSRTIAAIGTSASIDLIFQNKGSGNKFFFNTTSGNAILQAGGSASQFNFNSPVTIQGLLSVSAQNIATDTSTGTKIGTTTSQKLGLWNATPIVQPTTAIAASTFVANTSGTLNDSATWDGYTIGQVVKALRNFGLLA